MARHKLMCQNLGTQTTQCMQIAFLSVSLERKLLVEVQRRQFSAVQRQLAEITKRNNTTMKEGAKKSSTRLPAQVPASSVAKISRWQRKTGARRAQCQAKKTGKIEEKVANATKRTGKRKKKQCSPPHHVDAKGNGALGGQSTKASVHKAWQISPICRLLVEGPSCLTERNTFTTNLKVVPCFGDAMRVKTPSCKGTAKELCTRSWAGNGTKLDYQ